MRGTATGRETHQVDDNIDLELANEQRHVAIAFAVDVDEAIECALQPRAHVALIVGAKRDGDHLEARAIVPLDQARR